MANGFDFDTVLHRMTWTQMKLFARVARQRQIDEQMMQAAIIHNPYKKTDHEAQQLFRELGRERSRVIYGDGRKQREPVSIADMRRMFGNPKVVMVTREELEAKKRPGGGPAKR